MNDTHSYEWEMMIRQGGFQRRHFTCVGVEQTRQLAENFARVALLDNSAPIMTSRAFKLGILGHVGSGKTGFSDMMFDADPTFIRLEKGHRGQFIGNSNNFGHIRRLDNKAMQVSYTPEGALGEHKSWLDSGQWPWLNEAGIDVTEHFDVSSADTFDAMIVIERASGGTARHYEFFISGKVAETEGFRSFDQSTSGLKRGRDVNPEARL